MGLALLALVATTALARVRVEGDLGLPRDEVAGVLGIEGREPPLDVLVARIHELSLAYARAGYLDATIRLEEQGEERVVRIACGPRVLLARRDVEGLPEGEEKQLTEAIPPSAGRPIGDHILGSELEAAVALAAEGGYPFAEARAGEFVREGDALSYRISVERGAKVHVDSLHVAGADLTRAGTLQRITRFEPAPFRETALEELESRLRRSGLFSRVEPAHLKLHAGGNGAYEIRVTEAPSTRLSGVIGIGGIEQTVNGLVDVDLANLFGTARSFQAHWEGRGEGRANYAIRYREPWVLAWPVAVSGAFQQEQEDTIYTRSDWIADVEIAALDRLVLRLGWQREETTRPSSVLRSSRRGSSRFGLRWDARDALAHRRGALLDLTATNGTQTDRFLDAPSVRRNVTTLEALGSVELPRGSFGLFLGGHGFMRVAPGEEPRAENLFAVGGARTLRGYEERRFRTGRGGVLTVEGRRYLGPGPARIFVFTDVGLFDGDRSLGTEGDAMKLGAGIGLRATSRLGLVGLDVGAAEDIRSYDEVRLHFSVEGRY